MLAELFNASWKGRGVLPLDALEDRLRAVCDAGQAAWPGCCLSAEEFVPYLAQRLGTSTSLEALGHLRETEIYLCAACAKGDPAALELLDRHYLARITLGRNLARVSRDEVIQLLRIRLLTAEEIGKAPKIAEYAGTGALAAWLRVAATRLALNLLRVPVDGALDDDLVSALEAPGDTAELAHVKETYQQELRAALHEGFRRLEPRQRNLLRQHFLDRVTAIELAGIYRVHRATVGRWLDEAREELMRNVRTLLAQNVNITTPDCSELGGLAHSPLLELLASRVDVNVRELLATQSPPKGEGNV